MSKPDFDPENAKHRADIFAEMARYFRWDGPMGESPAFPPMARVMESLEVQARINRQ